MHVIAYGMVNTEESKGGGVILVTEQNAFFFLHDSSLNVRGLILFLIGYFFVLRKAKKNPPKHMIDPEIQLLDEKSRRKLLSTKLVKKVPLTGSTIVQETVMGYAFGDAEGWDAEIASWGNKKRVAAHLLRLGIVVKRR